MGCFNAISRFQGGVESSISVLENYRWENSEPEEIIDRLQSASSTCNAWLWRIGTSLDSLESVSDEQRVLYSAVDTVYQTYCWMSWKTTCSAATMPQLPSCIMQRWCPAAIT